jgi:hypothetical protein
MPGFVLVVNERYQIDLGLPTQQLRNVIGAYPVAPVRCIRKAMSEEQDPHA